MTIFRINKNKENPYTMIPSALLRDETISWTALGLLCYLLSLPNDWKVHQVELIKHHKHSMGRQAMGNAINELIIAGYIRRVMIKDGRLIKEWMYDVFEDRTDNDIPFEANLTKTLQVSDFQHLENELVEKQLLRNTDITKYPLNQVSNKDNASRASLGSTLAFKVVGEYYEKYRETTGNDHPPLKKAQIKKVCAALDSFMAEMDLDDLGAWEEMIAGHFARTDKLATDWNINHFATDGIMRNLFYKFCY